jgi:hypothetical protein
MIMEEDIVDYSAGDAACLDVRRVVHPGDDPTVSVCGRALENLRTRLWHHIGEQNRGGIRKRRVTTRVGRVPGRVTTGDTSRSDAKGGGRLK